MTRIRKKYSSIICCFPCYVVYKIGSAVFQGVQKVTNYILWKKFQVECKKHALPDLRDKVKRRRRLTMPFSEDDNVGNLGWCGFPRKTGGKTLDQQQSRLFQLPLEIRLMIWEYSISNHEIVVEAYHPSNQSIKRPKNWWACTKTCRLAYVLPIGIYNNCAELSQLFRNHRSPLLYYAVQNCLRLAWS
jgi:hypothetical protein